MNSNTVFYYCFHYFITITCAFNFFPQHSHVFTNNQPDSYFGYSVLLQASLGENPSRVIVGSPKANSSFLSLHKNINEPGAVYSCTFRDEKCRQFLFDSNGNTIHKGPNGMTYTHRKDKGWLGCSLDGEDYVGGLLLACAPRWINQIHSTIYYLQNGLCYLRTDTLNIERNAKELIPLLYSGNQGFRANSETVYYYALGEAGMSAQFAKNYTEILLGSPGVLQWKGMIVKYSDDSSSTPIISQRSNLRVSNYDKTDAPNPYYVHKLEDFSYFGYATASGNFLKSSNEVWYVGGAPRGKNLYGQVLVYEYNVNDLKIHFEMFGRQQGEYFGSSIAVGDLNSDGVDDIIVGSPMYSNDRGVDVGCIYVFMNNEKGIFDRKIIHGPQNYQSRFGTAISVIGDINKDGFLDVVVGAPYYNNGQGAIFVYLSSKMGINEDYSQKILASDINPVLRGFGSSLSKGVDIDNNFYNDIAVGSYKSGHVIVIKTRPVVTVTPQLISKNKKISIKTNIFEIAACLSYQGDRVPNVLDIKIILTADPFYKRVYFNQNTGAIYEFVKQFKYNQRICESMNISIVNSKSDFTQPIVFQMTYGLIENGNNATFCSTCPIIDPRVSNATVLTIPYETGCGSDNICQPDLKLFAKFNYEEFYLVIGSRDQLDISVEIQNVGEPAFLCRFYTEIPADTSFQKIPDVCQQLKTNLLMCSVGNPTFGNETKRLTLHLDLTMLTNKENLSIKMNVTSVGSELNIKDNSLILEQPLKTEVDVSVIGISVPEQFTFVNEEKLLTQDKFLFAHQFTVHNLGPSPLDELELNFLIPQKIGETTVVDILEPDVTLDGSFLECSTSNSEGFYNNISQTNPTELDSNERNKRSIDALKGITNNDNSILRDLPSNRTFSLNCVSPTKNIVCFEVKCVTGPLKKYQAQAIIKFNLIANLKVLDEMRNEKNIIVITSVVQPISKYLQVNMTYTNTVLLGSLRPQSILIWVILGSLLGLILLCAIIFGLYKFEFFRRRDHEKLLNEKEVNLVQTDDEEEETDLNNRTDNE